MDTEEKKKLYTEMFRALGINHHHAARIVRDVFRLGKEKELEHNLFQEVSNFWLLNVALNMELRPKDYELWNDAEKR